MKRLQLYVIPPSLPFADTLAEYVLHCYGQDRLTLPGLRLLMPSRRSIRTMQDTLLRLNHDRALLLPVMHPIGELEEEELLLSAALPSVTTEGLKSLPEAADELQRLVTLTRWVWRSGKVHSLEQALHMALDLCRLLDEMEREELSFDGLKTLVPNDYAAHWQHTLALLELISGHWPERMKLNGQIGIVARRSKITRLIAECWKFSPPAYPVIAAGTTGSIPATAALLQVIAQLPEGMVVLPGLDKAMCESDWQQLEETHPQFGLKQLLQTIGVSREEVEYFPGCEDRGSCADGRTLLLRHALQPKETTAEWHAMQLPEDGTRGLRMIECEDVRQEAKVVSLLMRETLEHQKKTAALITTDRVLARRVKASLKRYGIAIDDSAGMPLADTPVAQYFRLVADMVAQRLHPVVLLAVLKHPMTCLGATPGRVRELARSMELAILRGVRLAGGIPVLREQIGLQKSIDESEQQALLAMLDRLEAACAPLLPFFDNEAAPVSTKLEFMLKAHFECVEMICEGAVTDEKMLSPLWKGAQGTMLRETLSKITAVAKDFPNIDPASYVALLDTLLRTVTWRPQYGVHPQLHILSPMEARLQQYDLLILSGLNEDSWPMAATGDPWLSRPMRKQMGLPSPERAIGQSAHDFYTLAHHPDVVLTRAKKISGTATIPSRWWSRLEAVLEKGGQWNRVEDPRWGEWAEQLDTPEQVVPATAPEPRPPVSARPKRLSVTQLERLMRDPYSVYAARVLQLKKLDPLDKDPSLADFGNLTHNALELFVRRHPETLPDTPYAALLEAGKEAFADFVKHQPALEIFWWPRFERIARWLADEEQERRNTLRRVMPELWGEYHFTVAGGVGEFCLHARMDRLEMHRDGSVTLIDYKTGQVPSQKEVECGFSPQLPLEALIVQRGAVEGMQATRVGALEYWKLSGGMGASKITRIASEQHIIEEAERGLHDLIGAFYREEQPYLSCPFPRYAPRYNDYAQLARIEEWQG